MIKSFQTLILLLCGTFFSSCSIEPINKVPKNDSYALSTTSKKELDLIIKRTINKSESKNTNLFNKSISFEKKSDLSNDSHFEPIPRKDFVKYTNERVKKFWIHFFTKRDRQRFKRHMINAMAVEKEVKRIFRSHKLPEELFFVGLIESGFNLKIKSRSKATGPWQFMKGTGKRYGLKINQFQDERYNLIKSTHAAARYFKDLYNIFGSWDLALVAYNTGEYKVIRSIRKARSRDLKQLVKKRLLYRETINYIPKLLAAKQIYLNQTRYGFNSWKLRNLSFRARYKYNLKNLNQTNIKKNKIRSLKQVPQNKFFTYKVKRGDNLTLISKITEIPIRKIMNINNMRSAKIFPYQKLSLPIQMKVYTVKRGDNLYNLSKKFKINFKKLSFLNSIKSNKIFPKQKIYIPNYL